MELVLSHLSAALMQIIGELSHACLERLTNQLRAVWGVLAGTSAAQDACHQVVYRSVLQLLTAHQPSFWLRKSTPSQFLVPEKHPPSFFGDRKKHPLSFFKSGKITPLSFCGIIPVWFVGRRKMFLLNQRDALSSLFFCLPYVRYKLLSPLPVEGACFFRVSRHQWRLFVLKNSPPIFLGSY